MNLTREYRNITSAFDSPVELSEPVSQETSFRVGLFQYLVSLEEGNPGIYDVAFGIDRFLGNEQEKKDLVKKWTGQEWDPNNVDPKLLGFDPHFGTLDGFVEYLVNLKAIYLAHTGSARQVFSHVISILDQYRKQHRVICYRFTGSGKSRVKLYNALMRYFKAKGARTKVQGDESFSRYWIFLPR
jgi:hypothetical protein